MFFMVAAEEKGGEQPASKRDDEGQGRGCGVPWGETEGEVEESQ